MNIRNIAVTLIWFLSVVLCVSVIMSSGSVQAISYPYDSTPFFIQVLGEGKSVVSTWSFLQADLYYHGGIRHLSEDGDLHDTHDKKPAISAWNVLSRLKDDLSLTEHIHLKGDQIKELLPWLYYSAEIDPHNVQAITTTAYYVADMFAKPEEAINYLRKGLKNNINSWEIYAEMGKVYFRFMDNPAKAVNFLVRAEQLMLKSKHDKYEERSILTFLAASYVKLGQNENAINTYLRLAELFPKDEAFKKKLDMLKMSK
ncbi:MAG: hypothetical protein ABIH85_01550 [Candidatus Omnitrophota bacterium]|nr:hypothetical protein [Candidatus Omnitrophota bacterium]MBU1894598.1 hypothetical protein [Candidatus Omnitrophota bacterium]